MIKTKKTKEILKEWRSFENRSLNEASYSPSSKAKSIIKAAAEFLKCDEFDMSDASFIGDPVDEEFEFMLDELKRMGELESSISLDDMIFTDDQTCIIDWSKFDKNSESIPFNDPDSEFYMQRGHKNFDLLYFKNNAESRNPWVFAFFPKGGSSEPKQWHGKLKIGGKGS